MPKHSMNLFQSPLFQELMKLDLPTQDYAVFGSGPMWAKGIRESSDIDVIARGAAWERAISLGDIKVHEASGGKMVHFADGKIEIYDHWYPGEWDLDVLIDSAELIEGVRFIQLDTVREWKERMGRGKDRKDIQLIDEYLSRN